MENEKKHDDGGMDHPELYTSFIYYLVLWSPACAMVCLILYLLSFIQRFNILYRKRFGHQYSQYTVSLIRALAFDHLNFPHANGTLLCVIANNKTFLSFSDCVKLKKNLSQNQNEILAKSYHQREIHFSMFPVRQQQASIIKTKMQSQKLIVNLPRITIQLAQ